MTPKERAEAAVREHKPCGCARGMAIGFGIKHCHACAVDQPCPTAAIAQAYLELQGVIESASMRLNQIGWKLENPG